ncbi:DUF4340 domain-containing protein [bacterium]|nr:MAG: DUF4340 domain-containing protein [bacterium]
MTQATKTLSIIFAVSVLLVFLRVTFKGTGNSEALSGTVLTFDKPQVNRVEVRTPEHGLITLQKKLSGWSVQKNGDSSEYPADASAVDNALEQISNLKPKSLLTRNEADFSRYQVDTTGTEVRVFDGNKELAGVILGRFNFVSQQEFNTYVRAIDKNEVVSVNGFLSASFGKNLDGWRDKNVWNADSKAVVQIDLGFPGDSSFTMRKVAENSWVSGFDTLSISRVNMAVNQLAKLKANAFVYDQAPEAFVPGVYHFVAHLDNGMKQELWLNPKTETEFVAKASGFDYLFILNKSSLSNSLLRGKAYFKK